MKWWLTHERIARVALTCALSLTMAAYARAQSEVAVAPTPGARARTITVVGIGRERGAPDTAEVRIAIEQTGPTAQAATQQAAKAAAKVVEALRNDVGPDGRVDTAGYQLTPVYRSDQPKPVRDRGPEIVGYTASNQLTVRTKRLDAVGTLVDAAIAAGAGRVDSLQFTVADPAPLQARALRAAGADAAAQASAIAEALHVSLRGIVEATTDSVDRPIPQRFSGAMMRAADASMAPTPIEPGEVTAEARVRVTYGID